MLMTRNNNINKTINIYDSFVPEVDVVETVRVQLPRASSPQQCTVISAQPFRPCTDTSTRRRARSIWRVPLGDVSDSSTLPRCDALSVTTIWTCSRDRTTSLVSAQPSVCITKSAAEFGPKLLTTAHQLVYNTHKRSLWTYLLTSCRTVNSNHQQKNQTDKQTVNNKATIFTAQENNCNCNSWTD